MNAYITLLSLTSDYSRRMEGALKKGNYILQVLSSDDEASVSQRPFLSIQCTTSKQTKTNRRKRKEKTEIPEDKIQKNYQDG